MHSGEVLHRFTGHKSSVSTLALSPDGDLFASGSEDGALKVRKAQGIIRAERKQLVRRKEACFRFGTSVASSRTTPMETESRSKRKFSVSWKWT